MLGKPCWLVVWNIFYFSMYLEESSQLTHIFQRGRSTTNQPWFPVDVPYSFSQHQLPGVVSSHTSLQLRLFDKPGSRLEANGMVLALEHHHLQLVSHLSLWVFFYRAILNHQRLNCNQSHYIYIYMYVCIYIYILVCMYIYIYI